jgi:hypothetical protein
MLGQLVITIGNAAHHPLHNLVPNPIRDGAGFLR